VHGKDMHPQSEADERVSHKCPGCRKLYNTNNGMQDLVDKRQNNEKPLAF
jgi:hypothetical protein